MWSQRSAEKDGLAYFMLFHCWNSFFDSDLRNFLL